MAGRYHGVWRRRRISHTPSVKATYFHSERSPSMRGACTSFGTCNGGQELGSHFCWATTGTARTTASSTGKFTTTMIVRDALLYWCFRFAHHLERELMKMRSLVVLTML